MATKGAGQVMSVFRIVTLGLGVTMVLSACEREVILEGERFDTRTPLQNTLPLDSVEDAAEAALSALDADTINQSRPITLAAAQNLGDWPQRGSNIRNAVPHLGFSNAATQVFSVSIGEGNSRRQRITADPVVADGRIFTLDSDAGLQATSPAGELLWRADLIPGFERGGGVSGGGLAVEGSIVLASTGYGELIAVNAADGAVIWRQRLGAGLASPTVAGGVVYVVGRDSQAWAIELDDGRIRWQSPASPAGSVLTGAAAPAITDRSVIFPFASGELVGALRQSGVRVWGTTVAGSRLGVAYNNLNDITGDPVVVGSTVYAGNQSGRVAAMEAASGERLWTAQDGAYSPVLPAGDSLFFVSDRNELIRVDASTGERIWGVELPLYVRERERRRKAVFTHFGPLMASGRLVVASGDGEIRFFNPEDGSALGSLDIRGGAATNPIIVGGTLYVVDADGRLNAYR